MKRISALSGCIALAIIVLVPGAIAALAIRRWVWLVIGPLAVILVILLAAAFGGKRKITPQEWAAELEKHLSGAEGPYDWDDSTSVTLADERMERLRETLSAEYDLLDSAEKRERFRQIIECLRRGEVPE